MAGVALRVAAFTPSNPFPVRSRAWLRAAVTAPGDRFWMPLSRVSVRMPERPDCAATCRYGYIVSSAVKTSPWLRDGVSLCLTLSQGRLLSRPAAAPGFLTRRITPPPSWDVMQRCDRGSN
jgi:hypothetical protein